MAERIGLGGVSVIPAMVIDFDKNRRRAVQRQRVDAADRAEEERKAGAATPQTVRRRQVNVVTELLAKGRINTEHKQAADEIARVYQALVSSLTSRVARWDGSGASGKPDWKASLTRAYIERYSPWRDAMAGVQIRHGYSLQALVVDIVVENKGVWQVAIAVGVHRRVVLRHLQEGLYAYAEMAGWTSRQVPLLKPKISASPVENAA